MPRELISQPGCPFDVSVAWGKDQEEVQVATLCEGIPTGFECVMKMVNEWLADAGMPPVDAEELKENFSSAKGGQFTPGFSGWTVSLSNRSLVNRLIRVLRRARDDAMGRDE
jgi:hypothetical protein